MAAPEVQGIDLFKIAGHSISGWIPSLKTGTVIKQPFCSQLEERRLVWLEYHPLVANYARGDIDPEFATKNRLPIPQHAPVPIPHQKENECPCDWRTLGDIRQNGLGRGWQGMMSGEN